MSPAEVIEVFYLVSGSEIDVLGIDSVAAEPGPDALGTSAGDHTDRESVKARHSDSESVLSVESPVKLAFQIGEDATVSHHAVDVERERFDILEICHFKL